MRSVAWVVAPLCLIATIASAEIFKCSGKQGVVVYQNFSCELDSLGSLPSVASRKTSAASSNSKPVAVSDASERPLAPRIGMSADEVRAIWGEPTDTFDDEPRAGGRTETWSYGSDRTVRFDQRSRVIEVLKQGS